MDCKKIIEISFLFFDNELDSDLREPLLEHLWRCPTCSKRVHFTRRWLIVVRRSCGRQAAPARLRKKILTSLPHRQDWGK